MKTTRTTGTLPLCITAFLLAAPAPLHAQTSLQQQVLPAPAMPQGAKSLDGPMTILLTENDGARPVMATVGHWLPLQTQVQPQPSPTGWEIRPAQPPDPEKDKVSVHLHGVYGAIWLGDGTGADLSDATSLTGLGVRAQYAFNRYIAIEGELMGASTGTARFDDVTYQGAQGELTRSAWLGRCSSAASCDSGKIPTCLLYAWARGCKGPDPAGRSRPRAGRQRGRMNSSGAR